MQTMTPIDVEDALRVDVSALAQSRGISASFLCPPYDGSCPSALFERIGGRRINRVADQHRVSVDVRASTAADAVALADSVAGCVCALPDYAAGANEWKSASIETLPYMNLDPDHPDVPRWTFLAVVVARASIETI